MRQSTFAGRRPGTGRRLAAGACALGAAAVLSAAVAHADGLPGTSAAPGQNSSAPTTPATVDVLGPDGTDPTTSAGPSDSTAGTTTMPTVSAAQLAGQASAGQTSAGQTSPGDDDAMPAHRTFQFRTVDDPADPTFNQLLGINDRGRIVGYFGSGADAAHPNKGFRTRSPYRTFVNENVPGSVQTQVVGINNSGVTVGFFVDAAGATIGFTQSGDRFTSVAAPGTDPAAPVNQLLGVSDRGIAAGFYNDAAGAAHGYTYDLRTGTFTPVVLPVQADAVTATGVNDDGDVSGFYVTGKTTQAFLLEHGGRFHRLSFGGRTNTQALGVNNNDQVVGSYLDGAGAMHGFFWGHGRLVRVDDPMGAGGTLVNGLDNRGRLVGFYVDAAGLTHGFFAQHGS